MAPITLLLLRSLEKADDRRHLSAISAISAPDPYSPFSARAVNWNRKPNDIRVVRGVVYAGP